MLIYHSHYCLELTETSKIHRVRSKVGNSYPRFCFWRNRIELLIPSQSAEHILKYTSKNPAQKVVKYGILLTFIDSGQFIEKNNLILMTSIYFSRSLSVLTATVVFLCGFVSSDVRQNWCVAVFHHELVTFSLVSLRFLLSLSKDEFLCPCWVCSSAVSQTDDWSHTCGISSIIKSGLYTHRQAVRFKVATNDYFHYRFI